MTGFGHHLDRGEETDGFLGGTWEPTERPDGPRGPNGRPRARAGSGGRNVVLKDSTLAVVSLRRRIARLALHGVAGLVAVAAVGYSAVLAKEARTLPALASIELASIDQASMDLAPIDPFGASGPEAKPAVAKREAFSPAPARPMTGDPFVLTSAIHDVPMAGTTANTLNEHPAAAEVEPAGPVVIKDRFAQDPSVRWFDGRPIKPVRKMWMTVTGYSADARSCGDSADGLTATLHSVHTNGSRLVAADPRVLDYGSMLSVPGYDSGLVVPVLDCGGAIKGRRLDLLFPTHEQARNWGVQRLLVTVWGYADGLPMENPRKLR